jgi:ABC-type nickel/cobalt efflux system permease component RcnA
VIILLFALGQGVFLVGVAAALVMAVGMGLTVSLVGLLAIAMRRGTVRAVGASSGAVHWLKDLLGVAGAAAIRRRRGRPGTDRPCCSTSSRGDGPP